MPSNVGKTVAEILKFKKAAIRNAPLPKGSPNWDDMLHMRWEEVVRKARRNEPGYKTVRKLLASREYNK